jgi:YidC/Oxa1 family membrane protein insertase
MIGTTFYQQRQMQKATPAGSQQQQAITRIMPLLFGIWGFLFPAGLVLYWTTTNLFQIGQQSVMFRRGMIGTAASAARDTGSKASGDGQSKRGGPPPKQGTAGGSTGQRKQGTPGPKPSPGQPGGSSSGRGGQSSGGQNGGQGNSGRRGPTPGAGGTSGGDRKKRRKR